MKTIPITKELLSVFRSKSETLIMEGYCKFFGGVTVYNEDDSYAVTARSGNITECCLYSDDKAFIDAVISNLDGAVKFCGVSPRITDYLKDKYAFKWKTDCELFVWNGQPFTYVCSKDLRQMDVSYAQEVSNGTPYHAALEDIDKCIKEHPSVAAYVDGKPVCWCLLHQEGSLGMLYTLPEYRRQGYALEVMTALVKKVVAQGDVPFAYIIEDNVASKNLAAKYNMVKVCKADYFEIDVSSKKS